jgi:spore maturation protein SpmB
MQQVIQLIIQSGETGVNLALYVLLPVMVVMMSLMRLLEDRGILARIALLLSPLLILFGLPGLGVFAILQVLLVSFAAPLSTFRIIEKEMKIPKKNIAATLAAIFTMSQANATFPLAVVGLNLPVTMSTSLAGGFLAAFIAYRLAVNDEPKTNTAEGEKLAEAARGEKRSFLQVLFGGGEEGIQVVLSALPALILAILCVNILRAVGAIAALESLLSPVLARVGIPGVAVLPMATKYLAGGTAMMAVTLDLMREGAMTAAQLNRIAGLTINPLDPVAIAVLVSSGHRVASQMRPAATGALVGILFRAILHFIIF